MAVLIRLAIPLAVIFVAIPMAGSIAITPAAPGPGDAVTIRLENTFGADAQVTSASINRIGNTFMIQQNVDIACILPGNPIVASEFNVGTLPAGTYIVTATVNFSGVGPIPVCELPPFSESTVFAVGPGASVPMLDWRALVGLAAALVAVAVIALRR